MSSTIDEKNLSNLHIVMLQWTRNPFSMRSFTPTWGCGYTVYC